MAIARRSTSGVATDGHLASGSVGHTVPAPAGTQAGDVVLAFHAFTNAGSSAEPPAGWTQITNQTGDGGRIYVYRRTLTAPLGSEVWAVSDGAYFATILLAYTGVDTVSPIEDFDGDTDTGTSLAIPALTAEAQSRAVLGWSPTLASMVVSVTGVDLAAYKSTASLKSLFVFDDTVEATGAFGPKTGSWSTSAEAQAAGVILHELDVAPNTPPWVSPTSGAAADVNAALTLDWDFSDNNLADTQSAYALKRTIGATVRWWGGTDFDETAETYITDTDTFLTLASGWGADGDANHKYAVRTKDQAGNASPYSSTLTVKPDEKSNPSIVTPADAGTVTEASPDIDWTVGEQGSYRVEILDDPGTSTVWDSGWVVSTTTHRVIGATLDNGVDYQVRVTTKTSEGLVSNPDTHTFTVDFVEPDTPTLTVTEDAGTFEVVINNPATGETVVSNDLYVRVASSSPITDGNRTKDTAGRRIATGLAVDATVVDYIVGSGVEYEYMVRAWTAVGAFADSDWEG